LFFSIKKQSFREVNPLPKGPFILHIVLKAY